MHTDSGNPILNDCVPLRTMIKLHFTNAHVLSGTHEYRLYLCCDLYCDDDLDPGMLTKQIPWLYSLVPRMNSGPKRPTSILQYETNWGSDAANLSYPRVFQNAFNSFAKCHVATYPINAYPAWMPYAYCLSAGYHQLRWSSFPALSLTRIIFSVPYPMGVNFKHILAASSHYSRQICMTPSRIHIYPEQTFTAKHIWYLCASWMPRLFYSLHTWLWLPVLSM